MKLEHKHNLINIALITLPTIAAFTIYFLSGGNFTRGAGLGFTAVMGFVFSGVAALHISTNRDWK